MRIIYFGKFIYKEILTNNILEDCPLVIDGHKFFYDLYEEYKLNYEFGCEANEYARWLLKRPLNMFRKAKIKCYFIFKGGDTDINKKISKVQMNNFDFETNNKYVSPVFLKEVCLQLLEEMDILYSTSVMETIDDCVALAEMLGCPVLSTGIEYFFRRVPYIPINTLKYSDPNDFIICKQYELNDFLSFFSITDRKAAVFVALTDVHLFPQNHFDNLFKTWGVFNENITLHYNKLLQWLKENNEDDALNSITKFLSSDVESNRFCNQVEKLLGNMNTKRDTTVSKYLYNNYQLYITPKDLLWFEKGVAAQYIAIPYINLYKHKFILGSSAIEKKGPTDSLMVSKEIIKYAYNLLTNYQKSDICVYQDADNYIKINTGDTNITKPIYSCNVSVFENGWKYIRSLELFEHFLVLYNINIDKIDIPYNARMLFIALAYFTRQKNTNGVDVTKEVFCFIISYVMLGHLIISYSKCNVIVCRDHKINLCDFDEARLVTKKYFTCDSDEAKQIFDGESLKLLVEMQYCLLHMNYLNTLCGDPYMPTIYQTTFNGTFIYKLLKDMTDCEPNVFIQNLFERAPSVLNFITSLINAYKELVST